jgi:hypothetical protein
MFAVLRRLTSLRALAAKRLLPPSMTLGPGRLDSRCVSAHDRQQQQNTQEGPAHGLPLLAALDRRQ